MTERFTRWPLTQSRAYNPATGGLDRRWIRYDDGTYEPVRHGVDLSAKRAEPRPCLRWLLEHHPEDWWPEDHGHPVTLNHFPQREDSPPATTGKVQDGAGCSDWGRHNERQPDMGQADAGRPNMGCSGLSYSDMAHSGVWSADMARQDTARSGVARIAPLSPSPKRGAITGRRTASPAPTQPAAEAEHTRPSRTTTDASRCPDATANASSRRKTMDRKASAKDTAPERDRGSTPGMSLANTAEAPANSPTPRQLLLWTFEADGSRTGSTRTVSTKTGSAKADAPTTASDTTGSSNSGVGITSISGNQSGPACPGWPYTLPLRHPTPPSGCFFSLRLPAPSSGGPFSLRLKRDKDGRVVRKIETVGGSRYEWRLSYDAAGRLTRWSVDGFGGGYFYDERGRRRRTTGDCDQSNWDGSDFDRSDWDQSNWDRSDWDRSDWDRDDWDRDVWERDGARVATENYGYTDDNRLLYAGPRRYEHDPNGFRCTMHHEHGPTRYRYAPDHRLLAVEEPDGRTLEYAHDGLGRRSARYCCGQLEETYAWLDCLRLDSFGVRTAKGWKRGRFLYGRACRLPGYMAHDSGMFRLHYDQTGSLRAVEDTAGTVVKEILYDPFGNVLRETSPDLALPLGFAGGLRDRDTGWVRFGWRDYDPQTGRWTATGQRENAGGDQGCSGCCIGDCLNGPDPLGVSGSALPVLAGGLVAP